MSKTTSGSPSKRRPSSESQQTEQTAAAPPAATSASSAAAAHVSGAEDAPLGHPYCTAVHSEQAHGQRREEAQAESTCQPSTAKGHEVQG
ncbi:hypothetical protein MTO96_000393 [Rhipicephalus appendiculatus]